MVEVGACPRTIVRDCMCVCGTALPTEDAPPGMFPAVVTTVEVDIDGGICRPVEPAAVGVGRSIGVATPLALVTVN